MKSKRWLLISLLLLPLITTGCQTTDQKLQHQDIAGTALPSADEARHYVIESKLLTKVEQTEIVPIRFLEYGPKYLMVQGRDAEDRKRIIWLVGNASNGGIRVVSEALSDAFLPESHIRELLKVQGEIEQLFLAPNDRAGETDKNKPIWVALLKDKKVVYLDPVTGQKLPKGN